MEMTPILPPVDRLQFSVAKHEVNEWRGRCLNILAKAEQTVSHLLCVMRPVDKLPPLVGLRFRKLREVLDGHQDATKVVAALKAFGPHSKLRNFLCHGQATIALQENGDWVVLLSMIDGTDGFTPVLFALTKSEARAAETALHADCQRLVAHLSCLETTAAADADRQPH